MSASAQREYEQTSTELEQLRVMQSHMKRNPDQFLPQERADVEKRVAELNDRRRRLREELQQTQPLAVLVIE